MLWLCVGRIPFLTAVLSYFGILKREESLHLLIARERERERLPQKFTWIFDAVLSGLHISLFGSPAQDFHQEANNRVDV